MAIAVAVTVPVLSLVPVTPMKPPTFSADALDVVPPPGPGFVVKVVLEVVTIVTALLAVVSTVMSAPFRAVIVPETVGRAMAPGGRPRAAAPA
jgi:hypothetical protein